MGYNITGNLLSLRSESEFESYLDDRSLIHLIQTGNTFHRVARFQVRLRCFNARTLAADAAADREGEESSSDSSSYDDLSLRSLVRTMRRFGGSASVGRQ